MPSNPCLRLVLMRVKFLLTHKICNIDKIVHTKSHLKVPLDFKACKLSPFFLLLPFKGGYFNTVDLAIALI